MKKRGKKKKKKKKLLWRSLPNTTKKYHYTPWSKLPWTIRFTSRTKAGFCPPALVRPCMGCCVHAWVLQHKESETAGVAPEEAMKMLGGLEHLSYQYRLRHLGLFSLDKSRLQGDLIVAFHYLKGTYEKEGKGLLCK